MSRIRTIKPDIHLDEDLWDLECETGLPLFRAFVGLWNHADKEGRFEWRPRKLKAKILPYWDGDFSRVLDALTTRAFVVRYTCQGREFGVVRTFKRHQVINNREAESVLPAPPDGWDDSVGTLETSTRAPRVRDACTTREVHTQAEGKGREGKGRGKERKGVCTPPRSESGALAKPSVSSLVWDSYSQAYRERYGADPTRNAKVNSQLKAFCGRVPHEDAAAVAATYVRSNNRRYVAAGHSVGCLLQDAEKLRTELLTGRQGTAHGAAKADRQTGRLDEYEQLFAKMRALDEQDVANQGAQ